MKDMGVDVAVFADSEAKETEVGTVGFMGTGSEIISAVMEGGRALGRVSASVLFSKGLLTPIFFY